MIRKLFINAAFVALAAAMQSSALASVILYNNETSPVSGTNLAPDVRMVSSFSLQTDSVITSVNFISLNYIYVNLGQGQLASVNWKIYDLNPFLGGRQLARADAAEVGGAYIPSDSGPSERFRNTFDVPDLELTAGKYWLELSSNTNTNGTRPIRELGTGSSEFWIAYGNGEFAAQQGSSPNFQIVGTAQIPEPSSLAIVLAGLIAVTITRRAPTAGKPGKFIPPLT